MGGHGEAGVCRAWCCVFYDFVPVDVSDCVSIPSAIARPCRVQPAIPAHPCPCRRFPFQLSGKTRLWNAAAGFAEPESGMRNTDPPYGRVPVHARVRAREKPVYGTVHGLLPISDLHAFLELVVHLEQSGNALPDSSVTSGTKRKEERHTFGRSQPETSPPP